MTAFYTHSEEQPEIIGYCRHCDSALIIGSGWLYPKWEDRGFNCDHEILKEVDDGDMEDY